MAEGWPDDFSRGKVVSCVGLGAHTVIVERRRFEGTTPCLRFTFLLLGVAVRDAVRDGVRVGIRVPAGGTVGSGLLEINRPLTRGLLQADALRCRFFAGNLRNCRLCFHRSKQRRRRRGEYLLTSS